MFLLKQSTHRMVIQYHPQVGHLYVPNLKARIPHELGGYYVTTNSTGFRSDIEFVKRRSNKPRILFFGDSITAGDGCDNHQRFAELAGRSLNAEIYNYGLSGSGTDQQLLIYENLAQDVEADLIVLCVSVENIERIKVGFRETIDRTTGQHVLVPKPYFVLEDGELLLEHVPVPLQRPRPENLESNRYYGITHHPWRHLLKLRTLYHKAAKLNSVRTLVGRHFPNLRSQILRSSGFQPYPDYQNPDSRGWTLMKRIIERFHERTSPIPLLVVPLPTYFFYYDEVKPVYQDLYETLESQGLHVASATKPLRKLSQPQRRELCFRRDKTHFSPQGHEEIAKIIVAEIRRHKLLPSQKTLTLTSRPQPPTPAPAYILGISCFYHNSAAALIKDGEIIAAAEEERFTRVKNDRRFPDCAVNFCLEQAGIQQNDLRAVVYYDNAYLTFERLMHTLLSAGSDGAEAWRRILPSWIKYKLNIPQLIRRHLRYDGKILQEFHHRSHAASAFYLSPFESAAILTVDGVGEWATASIGRGSFNRLELIKQMEFPHSLGLLYSAFTQFIGFEVNEGEYKLMGLAPYGEPAYVETILKHLVDLKEDGSVELNMDYFAFLSEPTMTNGRFAELFGGPARAPESRITRREVDLARSIQVVTEEAILRMAKHAHRLTGERYLCLAGGVALNCVANGRLLREGPFDDIWIQPAAGDAGGALGAALDAYHTHFSCSRSLPDPTHDRQHGTYLGPEYSAAEIRAFLDTHGYPYRQLDPSERSSTVASFLKDGKVIGHFAGRMEFGPRALGSRSIIGDARNEEMQVTLNLKTKFRESFRPFAPAVLRERANEYFDLDRESPYMLLVAPVKDNRRKPFKFEFGEDLLPIIKQSRSDIPAVTHVDYSARVQTTSPGQHRIFHDVIEAFEKQTGCAVIVNTSFNVRGEPIICTPGDAYRCFMQTGMDVLILQDFLLVKEEQPPWPENKNPIPGAPLKNGNSHEGPFLQELSHIFEEDFVKIAADLRMKDRLRIKTALQRTASTWVDLPLPEAVDNTFLIPAELDRGIQRAEVTVDAMLQFWRQDDACEALRPVLVKLVRLGAQYLATEALEEEVPQSIYVMF